MPQLQAEIAQLAEHLHGKQKVPGSIPGLGSIRDFRLGFRHRRIRLWRTNPPLTLHMKQLKYKIIAGLVILAGLIAVFSLFYFRTDDLRTPDKYTEKISVNDYPKISEELDRRINELSPTPPAEQWTIETLEFVRDHNLGYITYHDTYNVFRILVEIGKKGDEFRYHVKGTFEKTDNGWRLNSGQDLGAGKALIKVN